MCIRYVNLVEMGGLVFKILKLLHQIWDLVFKEYSLFKIKECKNYPKFQNITDRGVRYNCVLWK